MTEPIYAPHESILSYYGLCDYIHVPVKIMPGQPPNYPLPIKIKRCAMHIAEVLQLDMHKGLLVLRQNSFRNGLV